MLKISQAEPINKEKKKKKETKQVSSQCRNGKRFL
jgi:hypothetical protein